MTQTILPASPSEQERMHLVEVVDAYEGIIKARTQPQNTELMRKAETALHQHFGQAEQFLASRKIDILSLRRKYEQAKTTKDTKLIEQTRKTLIEAVVRCAALYAVVDAYQEVQRAKGTKNQAEINKAMPGLHKVFAAAERDAVYIGKRQDINALRHAYNEARRGKHADVQQKEDALIKAVVEYAALTIVVEAYHQHVQLLKAQKAEQKKINEAKELLYKAVRSALAFAQARDASIVALTRAYNESWKNKAKDLEQKEDALIRAVVEYAAKVTNRAMPDEALTLALERAKTHTVRVAKNGPSLSITDRARAMYIVGQQGTGKTTMLTSMILQDINAGYGLLFVDVHGDATRDILRRLPPSRINDVILVDYNDCADYPIPLNPFECLNASDRRLVSHTLRGVLHIFERAFGVTADRPMVSQYLRNITVTLIENPGMTLADISLFFNNPLFRSRLVRNVKNAEVRRFWEHYEALPEKEQELQASYIVNKVTAFTTDPITLGIFGQGKNTLNFRSIMDERKILILRIPGGQVLELVGTIIVARLFDAALSRADMPESDRVPFFLYLDEFQNLNGIEDVSTIIAEARKYNVCTLISHQFRDQLSGLNKAAVLNVGSKIMLRLSGRDSGEMAKECDRKPIKVPTGEIKLEPKRTPVLHPIEWVVTSHHTHSNQTVTAFFRQFEPLVKIAGETPRGETPGTPGGYVWNRVYNRNVRVLATFGDAGTGPYIEIVRTLIRDVNTYLHKVMEEKDASQPFSFSLPETPYSPYANTHGYTAALIPFSGKGEGYKYFVEILRYVAEVLADEPFLAPNGEYIEVKVERELTTSEVEDRIANALATLPNFQAVGMFEGKQVPLYLAPLSPGGSEESYRRVLATIQTNTRTRYAKKYEEVMEEVAKRQEIPVSDVEPDVAIALMPDLANLAGRAREKRYSRRGQ
jgi:hypothetical protein